MFVDLPDAVICVWREAFYYTLNTISPSSSPPPFRITLHLYYVTDGMNRRVAKKHNGDLEDQYVFEDSLRIAGKLDASGNLVQRYMYGTMSHSPDVILESGRTLRVITDHLGSPRLIVNSETGEILRSMNHDAWGRVLEDSNPMFSPHGFAGGIYDPDTKLVLFGARSYDPEAGRFMSKDPILFAGGDTNLYGYVTNDPVNLIDPMGTTAQDVANAIRFVSARMPGYVSHTTSYANLPYDSGQAKPRITPFGNNSIVLDSRFLGPLDDNLKFQLLDTIYHENLHLQDGFWGSMGLMMTGRYGARHNQIGQEGFNFARDNLDSFKCGN